MSVLIKGMEMPRGCDECYIREKDTCPLLKVNVGEWGRRLNCPIVELPDHGDLVDRDAYLDKLRTVEDEGMWAYGAAASISTMPVVIPAERSEE